MLTGPAGRCQSRRCRSVHGSQTEPSIWCPPVQGARAPTEHPNPASSAFGCRLWTPSLSRRASRTVEPAKHASDSAGRSRCMPSDQRKPWPASTHRSPIDYRRFPRRPPAHYRRSVPPQPAELASVIEVHAASPSNRAFSAARRANALRPPANTPGCPHQTALAAPAGAAPGTTCDPTAGKDGIAGCRSSSYGPEVGTSVRSAPSDCFACRFLSRSPHRGHDCRGLKPRLRRHSFHRLGTLRLSGRTARLTHSHTQPGHTQPQPRPASSCPPREENHHERPFPRPIARSRRL